MNTNISFKELDKELDVNKITAGDIKAKNARFNYSYEQKKVTKEKELCICIDGILERKCTAKLHNW